MAREPVPTNDPARCTNCDEPIHDEDAGYCPCCGHDNNDDDRELYPLSKRELATVLAALRAYQNPGVAACELSEIADAAGPKLTAAEIDDLCESLNTTSRGFAIFEAAS